MQPLQDIDPVLLVESAPVPWCLVAGGELVSANLLLASLVGAQHHSDLQGRRLISMLHPQHAGVVAGHLAAGGRWQATVRLLGGQGDEQARYVRITAADVTSSGQATVSLLVVDDLTELHAALEELRLLRDQAVRLADHRRDFVATVTHEMRAPLHAILGLGELAEGIDDAAEQRSLLRRVIGEATRLRRTVDELLALARADADDIPVELRDVHLRPLMERIRERVARSDRTRARRITVTVADGVPSTVRTDEYRLDRILTNLVANAATYASDGRVEVRVDLDGSDHLRIAVVDDGPGVPEGYRDQIFEPFVRVPGGPPGGTGLGLPLVKSLVCTLGGSVHLACPPEGGSVFTVRIPMLAPSSTAPEIGSSPSTPAHGTAAEVLVVEDTEVIQMLAERQLESLGHVATVVPTGQAALAAVEQAPASFDLILMDLNLTDSTGSDVARQIREWERARGRARVPIIAITANAMPDTRAACLAAGMDDFVAKPVSLDALRRVVNRWHPDAVAADDALGAPLLETARLLQLAHDPLSADPVLEAADAHLAKAKADLDDLRRGDPPTRTRLRALALPHAKVAAVLGLVRLAEAWDALLTDDLEQSTAISAIEAVIADTRQTLRGLASEGMSA